MSTTRALAAYAVGGRCEGLPSAVVARTKTALLNILGAALGGTATRIGQLHVKLARATGGGVRDASLPACGDGGLGVSAVENLEPIDNVAAMLTSRDGTAC